MNLDIKRVVTELEYREIVPVEDAVGTRIDCLRGRIWITEQGCTNDVVLEAGESYDVARRGVAMVQALCEAIVALRAPPLPRTEVGPAARLEGFWGRWGAVTRRTTGVHAG